MGQIAADSVIAYNSHYLKENYPTPLAVVHIWSTMARWFWVNYDTVTKFKHLMFELLNYKPIAVNAEIDDGIDFREPSCPVVNESKVITEITHNVINMRMINSLWKDHPNYLQLSMHDYMKKEAISIAAKLFPEIIQLKQSWVDDSGSRDCSHWSNETNQKVAKLIARNLKL